MVFYVIACNKPEYDENQSQQQVQAVLGNGPKALGELYTFEVQTKDNLAGGQEALQGWHPRFSDAAERESAQGRPDPRLHSEEDREASQGDREPGAQN